MHAETATHGFLADSVLPVEVWSIIFLQTLSDPVTFDFKYDPSFHIKLTDPQLLPLVLSSVCRSWRYIALNLPSVWAICWLNYKNPELNRIWLDRAGQQLLTLHGQCTTHTSKTLERDQKAASLFMQSIALPYCQRWQHVKFDVRPLINFIRRFSLPGTELSWSTVLPGLAAPALETLHLYTGGYSEASLITFSPLWVPPLLSHSSALRVLKLPSIVGRVLDVRKLNPNLVDLELGEVRTSAALLVLSTLPRLQRFSIHTSYWGSEDASNVPHLVHQNLRHFRFTDSTDNQGSILNFLTFPSLDSFHFRRLNLSRLTSFLNRSLCKVTKLKFHGGLYSTYSIISILEHPGVSKRLEALAFEDLQISAKLLEFLRFRSSSPSFVFLEQLSFVDCDFDGRNGFLAQCIASRSRSTVYRYQNPVTGEDIKRTVQLQKVFVSWVDADVAWDVACCAPLEKPKKWIEGRRSGELHVAGWSPEGRRVERRIEFSLGEPTEIDFEDDGVK